MKKVLVILVALVSIMLCNNEAKAQRFAVSTNLVDWAVLSPNLRLDTRITDRLSLDISCAGNPMRWEFGGYRFQNFRFMPEVRYWFNRPFARHYAGFAVLGAWYSVKLDDRVLHGDGIAAGFTYGYDLVLSKHWNVEFTCGIGLGHTRGHDYPKGTIYPTDDQKYSKWIPVPMNLGISFTYIIN